MIVRSRLPPAGPPLFGRAEVQAAIEEALGAALAGHGSYLILTGEEGIGKSTMLAHAERRARKQGFRVASARALPHDFPRPFATIQELLQSFRDDEGRPGPSAPGASTPFSLLLAPLESRPDPPEPPTGEPVGREPPGDESRRLLAALTELPRRTDQSRFLLLDRVIEDLAEFARRQPVLLVLDDLHFLDDSSIEFLEELLRNVTRERLLVVASSIPMLRAPPRLRRFLEAARDQAAVRWRDVGGLSASETAEYVRWLRDGRAASPDEVAQWFGQTNGNPLFVEQSVRGEALAPGTGAVEVTSQRLEDVHRARFHALPEEVQRTLCYAAVIGKEFDFNSLSHALGRGSDPLSSSLDSLVRDGLLRESRPGTFEFVREALRQEAYAGLTESRRRILHRKVAESLEESAAADGPNVFELARHFYLARDWPHALEYSRRSAELAASAYAYPEAKLHLERAQECARNLPQPDPRVEFQLVTEMGRILAEMGELRPAIEVLATAVSRGQREPLLASELPVAVLWLASAHSQLWEHARARELARIALALFKRRGDPTGTAASHRILGVADWDTGDFPQAEKHHREAARIAAKAGNRRLQAHALIDLANVLIYSGPTRADEALQLYGQAVQLFAGAHDPGSLARVHMNRAILLHTVGRDPEAFEDLQKAVRHAEESGSLLWRVYAYLNEAVLRAEGGESSTVRPILERARALNERLRDRLSDQQIAMIDGILREQEGDLVGARQRYEEGLRLAQELEMMPDVIEMHYRLARAALRAGDRPASRRHLAAAYAANLKKVRVDLLPKFREIERELGPASAD